MVLSIFYLFILFNPLSPGQIEKRDISGFNNSTNLKHQ